MERRTAELDESKIDERSRALLVEFGDYPARRHARLQMEASPEGNWRLYVAMPSPTGDPRRNASIWFDERQIPTLEFGGWHSHADLWDENPRTGVRKMLAYLERIIAGEIVLAGTPTVGDGLPFRVIDLHDRDEVLDELTSPLVPPDMKLLSWSGAQDAQLSDFRGKPA